MENPDISPRVVLFEKHTIYNRIEIVLLNLVEECEATFKRNPNELSQLLIRHKTTKIPIMSFTNERYTLCSLDYYKVFEPIKMLMRQNPNKFTYYFIKCLSSKKLSAFLRFDLNQYINFSEPLSFSTKNFLVEHNKEVARQRQIIEQRKKELLTFIDSPMREFSFDDYSHYEF